jgi:hypothetical protein
MATHTLEEIKVAARMPCADYRAIWRTNRTEIALFLPARG